MPSRIRDKPVYFSLMERNIVIKIVFEIRCLNTQPTVRLRIATRFSLQLKGANRCGRYQKTERTPAIELRKNSA